MHVLAAVTPNAASKQACLARRQQFTRPRPQPCRPRTCCFAVAPSKDLIQQLTATNKQHMQHAVSNQLVDTETGCTVILLGVCFFAPLQQQIVETALQQVQADYILIEQPPHTSAGALLPHPLWIQSVLDHRDDIGAALQRYNQSFDGNKSAAAGSPLAELEQQLSRQATAANVGRDIIDPWETFGFYPSLDIFRQPASVTQCLELCGYLPGQELVVAAQHAMATGAQLSCIDAPIKLQEGWVKQLLQNFAMDEQQVNSFKPLKDLQANQQLLTPVAAAWDQQLAEAAQQLQAAAAAAGHQSAADGSTAAGSEQQSLLLYKVSKATAAALLPPGSTQQAIERMQRLQPLKWAHFALRQWFMARQIKEVCAAAAKAAGRQQPVAQKQQAQQQPGATAEGQGAAAQPGPGVAANPAAAAAAKPVTLLVVVGRQHVHGIQEMWRDPGSSLWRDRMPRSFAPSVVEHLEGEGAEAASNDSSSGAGSSHGLSSSSTTAS